MTEDLRDNERVHTGKEARELAENHWEWLESLLHKLYVDALIHGIKHGKEDK